MADSEQSTTTETTATELAPGPLTSDVRDRLETMLETMLPDDSGEAAGDISDIQVLEAREGVQEAQEEAEAGTEGEEPTEEAEAQDAPKDAKEERLSSKLKKLAREEAKSRKELTKVREELASRESQVKNWQKEAEQFYAHVKHLETIRDLAHTDPWEFVRVTGIDMDKVTEGLVSAGKHKQYENDPKVIEQLAHLEKLVQSRFGDIEAAKRQEEEQRREAVRQHALNVELGSLKTFSSQKADEFPLLSAEAGGDAAVVAQRLFEAKVAFFEAGQRVTTEEAAKYLEQELEKGYQRLAAAAAKKAGVQPVAATKEPMKTIGTSAKAPGAKASSYGKTEQERTARAYALLGLPVPDHMR